jgi:hypothetical protein
MPPLAAAVPARCILPCNTGTAGSQASMSHTLPPPLTASSRSCSRRSHAAAAALRSAPLLSSAARARASRSAVAAAAPRTCSSSSAARHLEPPRPVAQNVQANPGSRNATQNSCKHACTHAGVVIQRLKTVTNQMNCSEAPPAQTGWQARLC